MHCVQDSWIRQNIIFRLVIIYLWIIQVRE